MAEPVSFEELEIAFEAVLESDSNNFFELAEILNLDPKQDFSRADLSFTNLSKSELAGANLEKTNLKGANLATANLRFANLSNADLRFANLSFAVNSELDLVSALVIAYNFACDRGLGLALDSVLVRALYHARALAHQPDCNRAYLLLLALDLAHDLALGIDRSPIHIRDQTLAHNISVSRANARSLSGADFRGANLNGAIFEGANVEGAIMTNCHGLSPSDISYLKDRGAIFNDTSEDRVKVNIPVSR